MINLGENFISAIVGYTGELFNDFKPLILIILGLAIAFWIIETIIALRKFWGY